MKKQLFVAAVVAVVSMGGAHRAAAASITFNFDCTLQNGNPPSCISGGGVSYGTLTLTDSLVNPNRVDVDIAINPATVSDITGLDTFFINYDNSVTVGGGVNREFGLVSQSDTTNNHDSGGTVKVNFDALGPFFHTLDISVDPSLGPGFFYSGSLVVYATTSDHKEMNLNVSMFSLKDTAGFYSVFNTLPDNHSQQFGATTIVSPSTTEVAPVPEPTTLLLFGAGLVGARFRRRKRS